jgi:hypothetical protein
MHLEKMISFITWFEARTVTELKKESSKEFGTVL